jgi:hypothetical protein
MYFLYRDSVGLRRDVFMFTALMSKKDWSHDRRKSTKIQRNPCILPFWAFSENSKILLLSTLLCSYELSLCSTLLPNMADEVAQLKAQLAAVTAERDAVRPRKTPLFLKPSFPASSVD